MDPNEERVLLNHRGSVQDLNFPIQDSNESHSSNEDWSDGSSSPSTYCYDNSPEEWESMVGPRGDLLYFKCNSSAPSKIVTNDFITEAKNSFQRTSTRRSSRAQLSKLMNKKCNKKILSRKSSRESVFSLFSEENQVKDSVQTITLNLDIKNRHGLGRQASISEALLGISTTTDPEGSRVIVSGFVQNCEALSQNKLKIGDWIQMINNSEVDQKNFGVLLNSCSDKVSITFQHYDTGDDGTSASSKLFSQLLGISQFDMEAISLALEKQHMCAIYLNTSSNSDDADDHNVIYSFPQISTNNYNSLLNINGAFITIDHMLKNSLKIEPISTTITYFNDKLHIMYNSHGEELFLLVLPDTYFNISESNMFNECLIRTLNFMYQNLHNTFCNEEHRDNLNQFFAVLFSRAIANKQKHAIFEKGLAAAIFVPLPKEAQIRIDDALSEFASGDYRYWNRNPLSTRRKFIIIGTALYHGAALLGKQIMSADLIDIQGYLSTTGISELMTVETLSDMVSWREVYPQSCKHIAKKSNAYKKPLCRWFLLIVGKGKDMLCTILEANCNMEGMKGVVGPDPFYVEEAQATLEHLISRGICRLAAQWIDSWRRPQIVFNKPEATSTLRRPLESTESFRTLNLSMASTHNTSSPGYSNALSSTSIPRDIDSSEDSASLNSPQAHGRQLSDSDTEFDGYHGSNHADSSSEGYLVKPSMLQDIRGVIPSKITAGPSNNLVHFVHFDTGSGVLIAPILDSNDKILDLFRSACQEIHLVLQNTLLLRKILSQESTYSDSHRSLIAVREHGIIIRIKNEASNTFTKYWVVGRLLLSPIREVYVVYQDDAQQNMVELAFRMALNAIG